MCGYYFKQLILTFRFSAPSSLILTSGLSFPNSDLVFPSVGMNQCHIKLEEKCCVVEPSWTGRVFVFAVGFPHCKQRADGIEYLDLGWFVFSRLTYSTGLFFYAAL